MSFDSARTGVHRRACGGLVLVFLISLASTTSAQVVQTPVEGPRHVELTIAASSEDAAALEEVLRELLGELPCTVRWTSSEAIDVSDVVQDRQAEGLFSRVWLDATTNRQVAVFIRDEQRLRVLLRYVPLDGGLDEVAREQVGHIVESSLDALLAGEVLGVSQVQARRELGLVEQPPEPAEDPSLWLSVGLAYGVEAWSAAHPMRHGPGLFFGLDGGRRSLRGGGALEIGYRSSVRVYDELIGVRLRSIIAALHGSVVLVFRSHWALRFRLGGGVDLVHVEPLSFGEEDNVELDSARFTAVSMLFTSIRLERHVAMSVFFMTISGDVDLTDARYFIERNGNTETVFDPWRARFGVSIGIAFESPLRDRAVAESPRGQ